MKYVLVAIALAALCVPAFAQEGDNVIVKAFVHMTGNDTPVEPTDNATVVNEFSSAPYTTIRAYIGLTDLSTGVKTVSFKVNDAVGEYPTVVATQAFTNLLPGNLAIGNVFGDPENPGTQGDGITVAATDCMPAPFQLVGYVSYFYLGGAYHVEILDHGYAEWARWVVDCQDPGGVNLYCVWLNGGVGGMAPPAGDDGCEANTPVEAATWTSIKALYR
ncbi:hypothetical protein KAW64_06855 [bacterium]|nr:hypothetical protein [bacterium]